MSHPLWIISPKYSCSLISAIQFCMNAITYNSRHEVTIFCPCDLFDCIFSLYSNMVIQMLSLSLPHHSLAECWLVSIVATMFVESRIQQTPTETQKKIFWTKFKFISLSLFWRNGPWYLKYTYIHSNEFFLPNVSGSPP